MLVETFQSARKRIKNSSSFVNPTVVSFIMIVGLTVSLIAYSPLVRTYGEWEDSGNITRTILYKLNEILPKLPDDAVIHIYNFPDGISLYETRIPHAREVTYTYDYYNIKSWINLNYPTNRMKVILHSTSKLVDYPSNLDFEVKHEKDNNVSINLKFDYGNST